MMQRMEPYTLERKVNRLNDLCEQVASWEAVGTIRAAVSVAGGSRNELNQVLRIDSTHTAVTYDDVRTGDRFGGYRVQYVADGPRLRTLYLARDERVRQAVELSCVEVENEAKARAPKANQHIGSDVALRLSIAHKTLAQGKRAVGIVGTDNSYAIYVHEGTGIYSRTGLGRRDVPWAYKDELGHWHQTSGHEAVPFLEDAANAKRERVLQIFKAMLGG